MKGHWQLPLVSFGSWVQEDMGQLEWHGSVVMQMHNAQPDRNRGCCSQILRVLALGRAM